MNKDVNHHFSYKFVATQLKQVVQNQTIRTAANASLKLVSSRDQNDVLLLVR